MVTIAAMLPHKGAVRGVRLNAALLNLRKVPEREYFSRICFSPSHIIPLGNIELAHSHELQ
jgi:hypothetical protein